MCKNNPDYENGDLNMKLNKTKKGFEIDMQQNLKSVDMVNKPPHYNFGKYEVIDVLMDWFPDEPLLWQVGKYIARANHKNNTLQDLEKAEFYLKRRIKLEEDRLSKEEIK
jgi:hypothetical protein